MYCVSPLWSNTDDIEHFVWDIVHTSYYYIFRLFT